MIRTMKRYVLDMAVAVVCMDTKMSNQKLTTASRAMTTASKAPAI